MHNALCPQGRVHIRISALMPMLYYSSSTLKICPNLMTTEWLFCIVTDTDCDYVNLFLTFPLHF